MLNANFKPMQDQRIFIKFESIFQTLPSTSMFN